MATAAAPSESAAPRAGRPPKKRITTQLWFWVLIGITLGIIVGLVAPGFGRQLKILADLFIQLIKVVIGPVIFCTVIVGIASLGNLARAGGLALRALAYFLVATVIALFIGLLAGNLVQPGAGRESVLTTVVSVDPIYAKLDADENAILKYIKLSDEGKRVSARQQKIPAFVELGNETNFPHEGHIDFVDNRLDPSTGTVRARAVLKNWNPRLVTPGLFVRVRIAGAAPYRAALLDDRVISSEQGVKYVFVVKPDSTLERRSIETGPAFERKRIVKRGLSDGERVVSTRLQLVQPGMRVQPIEEAATAPEVAASAQ